MSTICAAESNRRAFCRSGSVDALHHRLRRSRTASALNRYCCFQVVERRIACPTTGLENRRSVGPAPRLAGPQLAARRGSLLSLDIMAASSCPNRQTCCSSTSAWGSASGRPDRPRSGLHDKSLAPAPAPPGSEARARCQSGHQPRRQCFDFGKIGSHLLQFCACGIVFGCHVKLSAPIRRCCAAWTSPRRKRARRRSGRGPLPVRSR